MRLILLGGIPHWYEDGLALPVMAGAESDNEDDNDFGGIVAPGGGGGTGKGDSIVGEKIIMGGGAGGTGNVYVIKRSPAGMLYFQNVDTGGKAGFGPGVYVTPDGRQIKAEADGTYVTLGKLNQDQYKNYLISGEPINIDPKTLAGDGEGSVYHPTPYGYTAPDPYAAGRLTLDQYDAQVANINSMQDYERWKANFEKDWASLGLDRNIAEATRKTRVAEEAGSRARTVAQDILPYAMPAGQVPNIPLLGNFPIPQVNLGNLFSQGGVGDLGAIGEIPGLGPMPAMPNAPIYPNVPDISGLINKTASGSSPMGWY